MLRIVNNILNIEIRIKIFTLYIQEHKTQFKDLNMLTFTNSENKQNHCFYMFGTSKSNNNVTHLISDTTSLISNSTSLLSDIGCDTCSFGNGSDKTIMAFGEKTESCGSVAYAESESCGSVAYSDGISASFASVSSGGDCSGGGCSYSC